MVEQDDGSSWPVTFFMVEQDDGSSWRQAKSRTASTPMVQTSTWVMTNGANADDSDPRLDTEEGGSDVNY